MFRFSRVATVQTVQLDACAHTNSFSHALILTHPHNFDSIHSLICSLTYPVTRVDSTHSLTHPSLSPSAESRDPHVTWYAPSPTCASMIMLTSLAPSPMAAVVGFSGLDLMS